MVTCVCGVIGMLIVYATKTGNVQRFIDKLEDMRTLNIEDIDNKIDEPYVLVTYTDGKGEVPNKVKEFLKENHGNLVAVCASGNRNWGANFAFSANRIAHRYSVPILLKFELAGGKGDVEKFRERVHKINEVYRAKQQNGKPV